MCRHWSHDENRSTSEPTRSLFQAVRDLFRRTPRPPVEAEVEAEVVPLPTGPSAQRSERRQDTDRPQAA